MCVLSEISTGNGGEVAQETRKKKRKQIIEQLFIKEDLTQRQVAQTFGKSIFWVQGQLHKFKLRKYDLRLKGKLSSLQCAYLAGFWDADGSFMILRRKTGNFKAIMAVTNKDKHTIHIISSWLSEIGLHPKVTEHKISKDNRGYIRRLCYHCGLYRTKEMISLTESIFPFLITKKKRAELFLKFLKSRLNNWRKPYTPEEIMIAEKIKAINRGG